MIGLTVIIGTNAFFDCGVERTRCKERCHANISDYASIVWYGCYDSI